MAPITYCFPPERGWPEDHHILDTTCCKLCLDTQYLGGPAMYRTYRNCCGFGIFVRLSRMSTLSLLPSCRLIRSLVSASPILIVVVLRPGIHISKAVDSPLGAFAVVVAIVETANRRPLQMTSALLHRRHRRSVAVQPYAKSKITMGPFVQVDWCTREAS